MKLAYQRAYNQAKHRGCHVGANRWHDLHKTKGYRRARLKLLSCEIRLGPQGYARASWFNDGNTACGRHDGLGFANRSLPCGTRVRFYYGGRSVVGVKVDYGPATWTGRDFDFLPGLNAALRYTTDARVGYRVLR